MRRLACVAILASAALAAAATSCGRSGGANPNPAGKTSAARIVSFSPAISRTLVDFHLQDRIVGRTPFCESLDQSISVAGDLLNVNYEALIRLRPTHLLIQPPVAGIDPHLSDLAREKGWVIGQWRLNGVDDIETMIRELPGVLFAPGTAELEAATGRAAELLNDIAAALSPGSEPLFRGRTLMVNEVDPVMAFGSGTYLHDLLAAMGGQNAAPGSGWVGLSLEDVVRLNPEAIIIVRSTSKSPAEDALEAAGPLRGLEIEAIRRRRVAVLAHPEALLPCSAVSGVAGELRTILRKFEREQPR